MTIALYMKGQWTTLYGKSPHLYPTLNQLMEVKERLLDEHHVVGEDLDEALLLQDEEPLGPISTVHHLHRLPQAGHHLLGAVAVVLVFSEQRQGQARWRPDKG